MHMVGYFEGIDSERGIAWRCADSFSLRDFLRLSNTETTPDHSWLSKTRGRLPHEAHEKIFDWVLKLINERGLVKGERIGVDGSTMEANAALRTILRRDNGETYRAMLTRMAKESGIETPSAEDLARLDRKRKGKKLSNEDWTSPTDPDARIARMKDGTTHLAYKPEHAVDLDTGAIVAAPIHAADEGDVATLPATLKAAAENLAEINLAPTRESLCELIADKAVEGRPDAREEAVALHTMHAAKGLEWPVVVPINTMTTIVSRDSSVTDRQTGRHYNPVFGVAPAGHAERKALEDAELGRERVRLWYVAATRAQELLILPRPDADGPSKAWNGIVELALGTLTSLDLSAFSNDVGARPVSVANGQTREVFACEASAIRAMNTRINWVAPSRDEGAKSDAPSSPGKALFGDDDINPDDAPPCVQGGRTRGLVMHKLFEEVLTGETQEFELAARASVLIMQLGETVCDDPANGLNGAEIAGCVVRTFALPEIAALRPGLQPELPVASCMTLDDAEWATAGIGDAIHIGPNGALDVVVDWKSDVSPSASVVEHYKDQVSQYLASTGAELGMVVFATTGAIVPVIAVSVLT
jgi:hypothetical protein